MKAVGLAARLRQSGYRLPRLPFYSRRGPEERYWTRIAGCQVQATGHSRGGPVIFTASYPASILRENDGSGYHVRFPDLPEALTSGTDPVDALAEAEDCLAEASPDESAARIPCRHPQPPGAASGPSTFPFTWRRSWPSIWRFVSGVSPILKSRSASAAVKPSSAACSIRDTSRGRIRSKPAYWHWQTDRNEL